MKVALNIQEGNNFAQTLKIYDDCYTVSFNLSEKKVLLIL